MTILNTFLHRIPLSIIVLILLTSVLFFYFFGAKLGKYKRLHNPDAKAEGIGPLEGALLGLLSLLLSFTFGMSASRYDARKALIVKEANNIGTVILRSDMYADSIRTQFRKELQEYVEARIAYYEADGDKAINEQLAKAEAISATVWKRAASLAKESLNVVRDNQMISALNEMIDIVTSRDAGRQATVPDLIIYLLISLTVLGSFIVGYSKKEKKNDWIIFTLYTLMTVMTIYTILDLDQSRRGLIQTGTPHEKIIELRNYFN